MSQTDAGDRVLVADPARRRVLGAGLAGAALALAAARSTSAAGSPQSWENDRPLLDFAMRLELAARDLYDAATEAGADPAITEPMREQHEAYAQALAGLGGLSASTRNDDVYDELESAFTAGGDEFLLAAYDLESIAVATHTELLTLLVRSDSHRLIASIAPVEARHCVVLADAAGLGDDLDALLVNDADPLLPEDLP